MNLFVDTTSNYIIFVLFNDNIIDEKIIKTNRNQSEIFVTEFDLFLRENNKCMADITMFYFAQGPGSFTGIRVGLSFAKALFCSGYTNIRTVNSLHLLLSNFDNSSAIIDARGNKSYYIEVVNGIISDEKIINNEDINDFDNINTYEKSLSFIGENIVKIVENRLYSNCLQSLYIKEAF